MRRRPGGGVAGAAVALAAALALAACSDGGVGALADGYCEYLREAEGMAFEERQKAIVALDERLHELDVRRGRIRVAIQRRCPRAIAEHEVEMTGVLGPMLREMRSELRAMGE